MSLFSRLMNLDPDLVPADVSLVRTECCGLVPIKGPGGAPLYFYRSDMHLLDTPTETHAIQEEQ